MKTLVRYTRIFLYIIIGTAVVASPLIAAAWLTQDSHIDWLAPHSGNTP